MNGIYDLYQKYLAEAYAPKQATPAFDPYKYLLYPPVQEGGDSVGGGITTLSPQQTRDRAMQMQFEAAAARDKEGNIIGGLTPEEQILMDRMTGKAPLTNIQKATLGSGFILPGSGILTMANLYAQRALDARRAEQEMAALQRQQDVRRAVALASSSGDSGGGTFSGNYGGGYGATGGEGPGAVGSTGMIGGGV